MIKIIETVRDGFQGLKTFIPTPKKVEYMNALLKVGFDAIDVGSFVSERVVPQMADTADVIKGLDVSATNSKLMVLVANKEGALKAANIDKIDQVIYPFSISPTFLQKNINADFQKSEAIMDDIINICEKNNKEPIIYLAMAFGNPYGDEWSIDIIHEWVEKLIRKGVKTIPLSDITGESTPEKIKQVYSSLIPLYPSIEFGFHLHSKPDDWHEKIEASYDSGCRRFDTVLGGLGGCPMTAYELLSNLDTANFLSYLNKQNIETKINREQLKECNTLIKNLF